MKKFIANLILSAICVCTFAQKKATSFKFTGIDEYDVYIDTTNLQRARMRWQDGPDINNAISHFFKNEIQSTPPLSIPGSIIVEQRIPDNVYLMKSEACDSLIYYSNSDGKRSRDYMKNGRYFRIDFYIKEDIVAYYQNVTDANIDCANRVLDTLRIVKKRRRSN